MIRFKDPRSPAEIKDSIRRAFDPACQRHFAECARRIEQLHLSYRRNARPQQELSVLFVRGLTAGNPGGRIAGS